MSLSEELQEAEKELQNYLVENNIKNVETKEGVIIVRNLTTDVPHIDVLRNNLKGNIEIIKQNS